MATAMKMVKGTQTTDPHLDQAFVPSGVLLVGGRFVLFALVYLLLRHLFRLIAGSSNDRMNTEVELVVLRHQLLVLKRQLGRPRLRRRDRLSMTAISGALPRLGGHLSSSARRRSFGGTESS